jgi:hypothetical protein
VHGRGCVGEGARPWEREGGRAGEGARTWESEGEGVRKGERGSVTVGRP